LSWLSINRFWLKVFLSENIISISVLSYFSS
jgi:hypothetical protein